MTSTAHNTAGTQGAQYPGRRRGARLDRLCRRTCTRLTSAIETSQRQLASSLGAMPFEDAPWRLPAGLTFMDDTSDLGRGIQFLSDSIVKMNSVLAKFRGVVEHHRKSISMPDGEKVGIGGFDEWQALERMVVLAIATAGRAQDAWSALQAKANGPEQIADNWFAIALLADELKWYADAIPNAYDLAKIGRLGPLYRQITR